MVSAIQAVPIFATVRTLTGAGQISRLTAADPSLPLPSTIVTLGATFTEALTYNAAGLAATITTATAATPARTVAAPQATAIAVQRQRP